MEWEMKGAKKLVIYSTPWINIAARNNTKDSQFPARFSIWDTFPLLFLWAADDEVQAKEKQEDL